MSPVRRWAWLALLAVCACADEPRRLPEEPEALAALLGDREFSVREEAQKALVASGEKAVPVLEQAAGSKDPEVAARARAALEALRVHRRDAALREVKVTIALEDGAAPRLGAEIALSHRFENTGKRPVLLVRCLDGSDAGRRGPHVFLEVLNEKGEPVPMPAPGGRILYTSQLCEDDFFELKPSEHCDPFALENSFDYRPLVLQCPGRYRVTLVYRLRDPFAVDEDRNGPVEGHALERLDLVPRGELRSNTLVVDVKPAPSKEAPKAKEDPK